MAGDDPPSEPTPPPMWCASLPLKPSCALLISLFSQVITCWFDCSSSSDSLSRVSLLAMVDSALLSAACEFVSSVRDPASEDFGAGPLSFDGPSEVWTQIQCFHT